MKDKYETETTKDSVIYREAISHFPKVFHHFMLPVLTYTLRNTEFNKTLECKLVCT